MHRTAKIHLNNGEKVEGVVDGFNNYEIRLKVQTLLHSGCKADDDILIFKQAIVRIEGDFSREGKEKKEDKSVALEAARDYLINLDEQMKEIGEYDQKTAHDLVKKIDDALSG